MPYIITRANENNKVGKIIKLVKWEKVVKSVMFKLS